MSPEITEGLKPLFEKARKENLLFRSNYQDIVLSPDELEQYQKDGRYRWGAVNWELITPESKYNELLKKVEYAQKEADNFKQKYMAEKEKIKI